MKDTRQWRKRCHDGLNCKKRIIKGIKMMIDGKLNIKNKIVKDYKVENVSNKVTKIVNSYIPYINKNIWKKSK